MSKQITYMLAACLTAGALFVSCQKESAEQDAPAATEVSPEVLGQISARGFSTAGVRKVEGGYLVEGDILLEEQDLASTPASPNLRIAEVEQYRTYNLVSKLPRTITVRVSNLPDAYVQGTDEAIARYNALNLQLKFQRTTARKADITIEGFYEGPSGGFITLGSAGFPSKNGSPYRKISMNTHPDAYGANPDVLYVASVIQHEMGHCIGFRHTDYMNRAFSCGSGGNEGAGNVGAVHIPGTPTGPDRASWMLACSDGGNRTFNSNDVVALDYLY
ncbi:M57 family metalloprotease [Chitinophaga japonensis]|uniref:Dual-action HEIGH metallo-peptidase n=1 Tax=Chitinophaga japonensis TaxID=104662 RepID=A0A562SZD5_CHIJA|nr:M57 family metalloprotease [Chitinophaga japonensis]TWI86647.1 dual-action HEIGH metallo-peptidase [Chitinophaga japonensis]